MKKIQTLDSIRLIMISTIILSHMEFLGSTTGTMNSYDLYFHNAYIGVNYFFLLSGFGLTWSFLNRQQTWSVGNCWSLKEMFKYAIRRVRRILPLYGFTMVSMIPYEISHLSNGGGITLAVKAVICSALLQSATGIKGIIHAFNGVCWFFSTLFVLYLIYPALERMIAKLVKSKRTCYFLMVLCLMTAVAVHFIFVFIEAITRFNGLSYESPYGRVWIFLIGMLIAYCFHFNNSRSDRLENLGENSSWKEIMTVGLFMAYWLCRNTILLYVNCNVICAILDIVIPAYMIYIFAFSRGAISRALNKKGIVDISKYSMFFYFIHYPIRMYLSDVEVSNIGKVFIILSVTIALSFMARKIQITKVRRF